MLRCKVIPYEGNEPYLFISYSHEDEDKAWVFPLLERLESAGFRLWYDKGINVADTWAMWAADTSSHLTQAAACIFFISQNFSQSADCRKEVLFAKSKNIPRTAIYLDSDIRLDLELELSLLHQQELYLDNYPSIDDLVAKLKQNQNLQACLSTDSNLRCKVPPYEWRDCAGAVAQDSNLRCKVIPYEGNEPYLFISYSHKDKALVFPIIEQLESAGFRLWYDEGVEADSEWPQVIGEHLIHASVCLFCISPNFLKSKNCRNEVSLANDEDIVSVVLFLDSNTTLIPGLKLNLASQQRIYLENYRSYDEFTAELKKGKKLQACLVAPVSPRKTAPAISATSQKTAPVPADASQKTAALNADRIRKEMQDKTLLAGKKAYRDCDFPKAMELYRQAYSNGNSLAGIRLGDMYFNGHYCIKNAERAVQLYADCMHCGNPLAAEALAFCYYYGKGVPEDEKKARTLFADCRDALEDMALLGSEEAQYRLGWHLLAGKLTDPNPEAGLHWMTKAAAAGSAMARYQLALAKLQGNGCAKDVPAGIEELTRCTGSPGSAYLAAKVLSRDFKDEKNAFKLFLYAAQKGHCTAADYLGDCYRFGKGTDVDYKEAKRWYRMAADNEIVYSINSLGVLYLFGEHTDRDVEKAISYFEKALSHNSGRANYLLGCIYCNLLDGCHPYEDLPKGVAFLQKAVDLGYDDALRILGEARIDGFLEPALPKDRKKGRELLKQAADKGIIRSMLQLADMDLNHNPPQIKEAASLLQHAVTDTVGTADPDDLRLTTLPTQKISDTEKSKMVSLALQFGRYCVEHRTYGEEALQVLLPLKIEGDVTAAYLVGCLYRYGIGVKRDKNRAKVIFRHAAASGSQEAAEALKNFWF